MAEPAAGLCGREPKGDSRQAQQRTTPSYVPKDGIGDPLPRKKPVVASITLDLPRTPRYRPAALLSQT